MTQRKKEKERAAALRVRATLGMCEWKIAKNAPFQAIYNCFLLHCWRRCIHIHGCVKEEKGGGNKRGGASFEIIGFWVSYIEICKSYTFLDFINFKIFIWLKYNNEELRDPKTINVFSKIKIIPLGSFWKYQYIRIYTKFGIYFKIVIIIK